MACGDLISASDFNRLYAGYRLADAYPAAWCRGNFSGSGKSSGNNNNKLNKLGLDKTFIHSHQLTDKYLKNRQADYYPIKSMNDLLRKITSRHLNDRIEITNLMAGQDNIEYRYPLFDVDLIAFYLSVPDEMKYRHRQGRYLHRAALHGQLPQAIQWRRDKHGTINPGLARIFANDAAVINTTFKQLLSELPSTNTTIFDRKMIEKLVAAPDEKLFGFKSLINKFFQLKNFTEIIENNFG